MYAAQRRQLSTAEVTSSFKVALSETTPAREPPRHDRNARKGDRNGGERGFDRASVTARGHSDDDHLSEFESLVEARTRQRSTVHR